MQHVERYGHPFTLVLGADLLEGCRFPRSIDHHQVVLVMNLDAVSGRDLDEFAREEWNAENNGRVNVVIQAAVFEDALTLKMVGGEIDDLLRRPRALERQGWLGEHRATADFQFLQAIPGVCGVRGGIVAADAVLAEGLCKSCNLAPVE